MELAKKKRMRVGYIEFNHLSTKYQVEGKFFVRDYEKMACRALNLHCSGCTNYQNSLEWMPWEFQRLGRGNQHVLFLTDGVPTQGDWEVKAERELAQELGVAIHTIFIGKQVPAHPGNYLRGDAGASFRQRQTATGSSASKSGINLNSCQRGRVRPAGAKRASCG